MPGAAESKLNFRGEPTTVGATIYCSGNGVPSAPSWPSPMNHDHAISKERKDVAEVQRCEFSRWLPNILVMGLGRVFMCVCRCIMCRPLSVDWHTNYDVEVYVGWTFLLYTRVAESPELSQKMVYGPPHGARARSILNCRSLGRWSILCGMYVWDHPNILEYFFHDFTWINGRADS